MKKTMKQKTKKKPRNLLLKFALFCFAAFFVFTLFGQQIDIRDKQTHLHTLKTEFDSQKVKNEELQLSIEDDEASADYLEKTAKKNLNYAKPQERIFVNIGGNG